MKRRAFIGLAAGVSGSLLAKSSHETSAADPAAVHGSSVTKGFALPASWPALARDRWKLPDLRPAKWIWYPSERTLPNSFVLFRREIEVPEEPIKATGWVFGDSRYKLEVNGRRVQWGPAPCDPRWPEADPINLSGTLHKGKNVLGTTVLYYGHGDGTWPTGNPGFLLWLTLEYPNGARELIVSDETWQAHLCRAWPPGQYKRWFLRALQEQFDHRRYPVGWCTPGFALNPDWPSAMNLEGSPNKPAICTKYFNYLTAFDSAPNDAQLCARIIPLLNESLVPSKRLAESLWVDWVRPAVDYFETRAPKCFTIDRTPSATQEGNRWRVALEAHRGVVLTFELPEQVVGFPYFSIVAPEGTVVDLITQESHDLGGAPLLYTTATYGWTRFVCRNGENAFECFDFESVRWLQLHIQGQGSATVHSVGMRRRAFPWKSPPIVHCNETKLQRLFEANINTIVNSATDQFVDGNGRERQQYAGDASHQVYVAMLTFGDSRLAARYLTTWSKGLTKDGYFLDNWPACDRLTRVWQRQMDLTQFGPQLDGGVQFGFDVWDYYLFTADLEPVKEVYPRLLRFAEYLIGLINRDGDELLPVTNLGTPFVWLDFEYPFGLEAREQRRRQCAFNLYAAGMFERALAPMCQEFGDAQQASTLQGIARGLIDNTVKRFWSPERRLFVDNLPWLEEDGSVYLSDRALAHAVLFDQCPGGASGTAISTLAMGPKEMGLSYPCNALWRLWALAKGGRMDVVLEELRARWASMPSVALNNTVQEFWEARTDSGDQWSHSAVAPLSLLHSGIVGLRPLAAGFRRAEIRPQLGDLEELEVTTYTGQGPVHFTASGNRGARRVSITVPEGCRCELLLPSEEQVQLEAVRHAEPFGLRRYRLPANESTLVLRFT